MKRFHWSFAITTLILGFFLGALTFGSATAADPTPAAVPVQGELLKVCIDKKSGLIRASSKCKPTEKAFVLGGPGAQGVQGEKGEVGAIGPQGIQGAIGPQGIQGEKGIQGSQGIQGLQGFTGPTGATGTVSGLRTKSIQVWSKDIFGSCGTLFGISMLSSDTSLRQSGNTISLSKSCVSMSSSNQTVYVP
jgi:hypothetical protein